MSLVEVAVAVAILAVLAGGAMALLVGRLGEAASSWNELAARHLALEALEWAAALPPDGIGGPVVLTESPMGSTEGLALAPGRDLASPVFVASRFDYPESLRRFSRRLEIVDATESPEAPLLRASVTVWWEERRGGAVRTRRTELWRLIGP